MFLFHTEAFLHSLEAERERNERRDRLLRELRSLRGATPPFDGGQTRRLAAALAHAWGAGRPSGGERQPTGTPCPEINEPMTP